MNDRLRLVLLATLIAAGCNGRDYVDAPLLPDVDPARLAQPPVLKPESESAVPPVQLETAVDEASKRDYSAQVYPERANVTLADVRQWSLENNLDVRVQQFNPTLGVTALDAEIAKFEAVLKANYTYNDNTLTENLEAGNATANNSGTLGIDFPLATGGVLNVGTLFNQADSPLLDEPWEAGFQLDLSMPIMRGFGLRANTASIVIAKMESQQVDARTLLETIRILANAEKSYWQLYAARRIMEVRERQHALAEEQLARARRRVDQGEVAPIELLRAQSGIGRTIEQLIVADNQLRLRARALKRFMNAPQFPVDGPTMLDPTTPSDPLGLDLDPAKLTRMAIANRMELLDLELQLAIDAERVALARNEALPLFTMDYQYQVLGDDSGLASAYGNLGDADPFIASVNASIPLGNEARRVRLSQAITRRLQRLATKESRVQTITQEVHDAVDNVRGAWRRVVAARLESRFAERTLLAEQRQFDVGLRTSVEVLDANARVADAQSREVEAAAQYETSLVDLAFATGTVLGEAQVTMPGPMPVPNPDRTFDWER
ncbi:MAG: TolC family protein [Planctomycetes bacterium]|nr:TolC family protein [Planctomycetota bacterium]